MVIYLLVSTTNGMRDIPEEKTYGSARCRRSIKHRHHHLPRAPAALSFLQNYLNPSKLQCAVTINRHRMPPETTAEKIARVIVIVLGILIGQLIASRLF
jgi:hypothetical protein